MTQKKVKDGSEQLVVEIDMPDFENLAYRRTFFYCDSLDIYLSLLEITPHP